MTADSLVPARLTRRCALSGLWLVAAMPFTVLLLLIAQLVIERLLGMRLDRFEWLSGILAFVAHVTAGALWGRSLSRVTGRGDPRRWIAAGAVGFGLSSTLAVALLNEVEQRLVWFIVRSYEVHLVFGASFTLAALLIAGVTGLLLGLALGRWRLALQLTLSAGLAAAITFALVALLMDTLGMRVGGPGAEARATMIVVSLLGMWSAGIVGSIVIGQMIIRYQPRPALVPILADSST